MSCLFCTDLAAVSLRKRVINIRIGLILCHTTLCIWFLFSTTYRNISLIHSATITIRSTFGKALETSLLIVIELNSSENESSFSKHSVHSLFSGACWGVLLCGYGIESDTFSSCGISFLQIDSCTLKDTSTMSRVIIPKYKVRCCADMTPWTYFTKRVDYKRQIWKITFKVGSIVPSYRLQMRNNLQRNTLPICTAVYLSYCIQLHVCSLFDWAKITSGKFAAHQQINLAPKGFVQYFTLESERGIQEVCNII